MHNLLTSNPFAVQTPEDISAQDAHDLFVNVFTDFEKLRSVGHTFINGPRGSGKSMMFRYLQPDCQVLEQQRPFHELPFCGLHVPIKNMHTNLTELRRLEGHAAEHIINEHVLMIYIMDRVLDSFRTGVVPFDETRVTSKDIQSSFEKFTVLLENCGYHKPIPDFRCDSLSGLFEAMRGIISDLLTQLNGFFKAIALDQKPIEEYDGPLFGYQDLLLPLFKHLAAHLPCFPDKPIFLLFDDADYLNTAQTKVLNSWISTRTHQHISIKVSTQLRYKTYLTPSGRSIDAPHDFSEIEIATIYTANHSRYSDRISEIINKRLKKAGIGRTAEQFFPEDSAQAAAIRIIQHKLAEKHAEGSGRGNRARDDVTRYARPDFIKALGGERKSTHTYSYSGFHQLVSVSSGIIRWFLEPASLMFSEAKSKVSLTDEAGGRVLEIPASIQNDQIRNFADRFLCDELDDLRTKKRQDEQSESGGLTACEKLENLLHAMGSTFANILKSDRSERRVFSIAFSDPPDREILSVIQIGIEEGYFHQTTIGNKRGSGRTRLIVLSRRLAPCFNLDPNSFAGYLTVTSSAVRKAMMNRKALFRDFVEPADSEQLELL